MKPLKIFNSLFLLSGLTLGLCFGEGKDKPYQAQGLTGTPAQNSIYMFNLWIAYTSSVRHISDPLPTPVAAYGITVKKLKDSRYAYMLQEMLELRAFMTQNKVPDLNTYQEESLKKVDIYLQKLDLSYPMTEKEITPSIDKIGYETLDKMVRDLSTSLGPAM